MEAACSGPRRIYQRGSCYQVWCFALLTVNEVTGRAEGPPMEALACFASWPGTVTKAQYPSRGVTRLADSSSPERGLRMTVARGRIQITRSSQCKKRPTRVASAVGPQIDRILLGRNSERHFHRDAQFPANRLLQEDAIARPIRLRTGLLHPVRCPLRILSKALVRLQRSPPDHLPMSILADLPGGRMIGPCIVNLLLFHWIKSRPSVTPSPLKLPPHQAVLL